MRCNKCGYENINGSRFCTQCGNDLQIQLNQINNNMNQQYFNQNNFNNMNYNNKSKLGTISLIIGIISIVLSFVFTLFILPVSITGLILGVLAHNKNKKEKTGMILNIIAIVIAIVEVALVMIFVPTDELLEKAGIKNDIEGKYNCSAVDGDSDEYLVTLNLNHDKTFLYGPYNDTDNNHTKGTYTYVDENKTNNSGEYKYYMVTFKGPKEDYIVNGKEQDHDFTSEMEFGITTVDNKRQGVIMFVSSYNMYYCYEQ